jgi:hypothetical protein
MIFSTTYRAVLSLTGAAIMTLGGFSMLQASVDKTVATAIAKDHNAQLNALHSATIDGWQAADERAVKPGA